MSDRHSRKRILEVATRLFKEKGFANVSVREICHVAGVSLPMVYYYFKDKRGLFQAVTRENITLKALLEDLKAIQISNQSPERKVQRFIEIYLKTFPRDLLNAGLYMREKTDFDRASLKRFAADLDQAHGLMRLLICEGMQQDVFRKTDPDRAADCILGMMNRSISQQAHFHRAYDPEETGDYVTEFALHALRPQP